MFLQFDIILQYVEYKEIPCKFILQEDKRITGKVIGRDPFMIYVKTADKEKGKTHFLFKHSIIDIIPQEDLDFKRVKEEVINYNKEKKKQKELRKA
ncbi:MULTISPECIES: RNA chaperone Hfq [Bacillus cereus group]|uniref:RNA chaperone Hfq n=1 Tax=Bacillus cereus group TaxID=86661 RepID=UPI000279F72B|nr:MULTISPECIES: RNA chaperone Hfq [Bacillus cereus group]EJR25200.1 hypothetical protein IIE_06303 [Bacillus cereus VD045]